MTLTYVCPECGYTGLLAGIVKGTVDLNIRWGCPRCRSARGNIVWLVETSDPRDEAA